MVYILYFNSVVRERSGPRENGHRRERTDGAAREMTVPQ